MSKIKLCGLSRPCDIEWANSLLPEYIGFVFAQKSKRYVSVKKAWELRKLLKKEIAAVGVFVNEHPGHVAELLNSGVIDMAQLHGDEDELYIKALRTLTDLPIIKAFKISNEEEVQKAEMSSADFVLLDSGAGTGMTFDWELLRSIKRDYFLAGGLCCENVRDAVTRLHPYALDVSSGIETLGFKDEIKMKSFVDIIRSLD